MIDAVICGLVSICGSAGAPGHQRGGDEPRHCPRSRQNSGCSAVGPASGGGALLMVGTLTAVLPA